MAEEGAAGPGRWLEWAFAALVAAGLAWAAWSVRHDRRLPDRFTEIRLGMDRSGVEALLGRPDWEGGCAGYVPYPPRADCSSELGYSSAFAPLRPVYYILQLDRNGRVIEAEPLQSP